MSLKFINGAYNRATGTLNAFGALSDALVREGHPAMVSRSGDREYADQLKIWNERMVLAGDVRGRRVYAKKTWQGKTWYQIHPDSVATPTDPPTSNHGKRRANDLAWPYNDASTTAHKRAQVLAPRYGISCEGLGFSRREDWHWTFWGSLGAIISPASLPNHTSTNPALPEEEDDDMRFKFGHRSDGNDEWMIVHPSLKDGYQVTTDQKRAIAWARLYGRGWVGDEVDRYDFNVPRADYIELQNAAKQTAAAWQS